MNTRINTKFIGIKEFRQNIADYAKRARKAGTRFVIMNRNKPLFELKPFAEDVHLDSFVASILEAEADIASGRVHSEEEILAEFAR